MTRPQKRSLKASKTKQLKTKKKSPPPGKSGRKSMSKRGGGSTNAPLTSRQKPSTVMDLDVEPIDVIHMVCRTLINKLNSRELGILSNLESPKKKRLEDELKVIVFLRNLITYLDPLKPKGFTWEPYERLKDDITFDNFFDVLYRYKVIHKDDQHWNPTNMEPIFNNFPDMIPYDKRGMMIKLLGRLTVSIKDFSVDDLENLVYPSPKKSEYEKMSVGELENLVYPSPKKSEVENPEYEKMSVGELEELLYRDGHGSGRNSSPAKPSIR